MFVTDCWYVAAWSDDVGCDPIPRTMLNRTLVLFRTRDGAPVALEDRCVHRHLPLSQGKVVGDTIRCRYHGLVFDRLGRCIKIPGQAHIPDGARVRHYPSVDKYGCTWVWMGDEAGADESLIPNYQWLVEKHWGRVKGYSHVEAGYQLLNDNLLDLSHIAYVHSSTIGSEEIGDSAKVRTEVTDDKVRVVRWTIDVPAQPTYEFLGHYEANVDRWQIIEFQPPVYHFVDTGAVVTGTGAPEGEPGKDRVNVRVCHAITPETERTSHYFWSVAHELGEVTSDPAAREDYYAQMRQVIGEDVMVLEAQQRSMDIHGADAPSIGIGSDAGPVNARRIIARLLERQARGPSGE